MLVGPCTLSSVLANHLESEFSESFKTLSKIFFFDDGFFLKSEDGAIS